MNTRRPLSNRSLQDFQQAISAALGSGDLSGAAQISAECRAAWPLSGVGWLFGSIAALLEDKKDAALGIIEERLISDPDDLQCLIQQAECYLALGRRSDALAAADTAAVKARSIPIALDAIADLLVHAGEHTRALHLYDQAIAVAPRDATLLAKRGDVQRFLGNFDLAAADYQAVLEIVPTAAKPLKGLAEIRRQTPDRNGIFAMERALATAPPGSTDAAILHFGLAKSYDDLGNFAQSWRHLTLGNRNERSRLQYDSATDSGAIDRMIAAFPDAQPAEPAGPGECPIFIVGLPRSGTTLVDRILGSHSQVHSAGEISALTEAVDVVMRRASAEYDVPDSPDSDLQFSTLLHRLEGKSIAEEYLARSRAQRGERPRFTDKLLTNFFYCPLILRAFPNARIVHVTRHPLAGCYAIYRTRFNGTYPFSYDLNEIGEFYIAYRRLMAHWHRVLPGRILDVAYEDVVTDLEPTIHRLLDYVGLEFEQECLEFHRNPAAVDTLSVVQVRQPLYDSSLNAWQNYADHLVPLRGRLESAGIAIP